MRTIVAILMLLSTTALAVPPSPACFDGAAQCGRAYDELLRCQAQSAAPPTGEGAAENPCASWLDEVDRLCRATASICDQDGSRQSPR